MAKEGKFALLKLPSGEQRMVQVECRASIGQVGNLDHENISIGKAGRSRWLGKRGHVRGVAMNPVDHPHGGGEGRSKGNHPQSPWGHAGQGLQDTQKEAVGSVDRKPPAAREAFVSHGTIGRKKGPFIDGHLKKKVEAAAARG